MSWQSYLDEQICRQVNCRFAAICSLDDGGGQIWAKYEDPNSPPTFSSPVSPSELQVITKGITTSPGAFLEKGIYLGGEKYYCIQANSVLIRGQKGSSALCIVATKTCLIVAVGIDGVPAGQLSLVVEKLADYLKEKGF